MENSGNMNIEEIRIQGLLDVFLKRNSSARRFAGSTDGHLDQDTLSAFVEGNLGERQATPVVSHLVDCSFCRHVTAELVKLDAAFADEPAREAIADSQPSRVSEVLGGLLNRIFGTGDGSVFAHHEDEKDSEEPSEEASSEPRKED
jgi:hypothetical protein